MTASAFPTAAFKRGGWLCLLIPVLMALNGCSEEQTAERKVQQLINGMADAVQKNSIKSAAGFIAGSYKDQFHLNKAAAMRSLFAYMRRHRSIHLYRYTREILVQPDRQHAEARVYVAMAGVPVESRETLFSVQADYYRFDLKMMLDDDDEWVFTKAAWQQARLQDF